LQIFRRLNQCASAGDGLALNRLAMARNGVGLQVYLSPTSFDCLLICQLQQAKGQGRLMGCFMNEPRLYGMTS